MGTSHTLQYWKHNICHIISTWDIRSYNGFIAIPVQLIYYQYYHRKQPATSLSMLEDVNITTIQYGNYSTYTETKYSRGLKKQKK